MIADFSDCLEKELVFEGGNVDDPDDPGGRTSRGVTQRVFSAWLKSKSLPVRDVYTMTAEEMEAIYREQYAAKIYFDKLPVGLNFVQLDGGVHSGTGQSTKWLQRALGSLYTGKIDGVMGVATLAAVGAVTDVDALIGRILDVRLAFMRALKGWRKYRGGWTSRVEQVRKISQAWAVGSVGPAPVYAEQMHRKAELHDAKTIPSTAPGAGAAGAGATIAAASAGATSFLGQIKSHLETVTFIPHVDQLNVYFDHASAVVTATGGIAGLLAAAGGGAWLWYAQRRAASLRTALDVQPSASGPAVAAPA